MSLAARLAVALVAVLQLGYIGLMLSGASSGDALGRSIAQGMALIVSAPLLVLTAPAAILALLNRWPAVTLALVAASAVATFVLIPNA
jgi:hypothetical protein